MSAYWYEKWELLKLSRRPVAYSGDLSESVTNMLPFATVRPLPCCWMVGHADRNEGWTPTQRAVGGRAPTLPTCLHK